MSTRPGWWRPSGSCAPGGISGHRRQGPGRPGLRILTPASELAVVGLMEVARHLPAVWRALRGVAQVLKTAPPDLAILVDFPTSTFGWPAWPDTAGCRCCTTSAPGLGLAHLPGPHPGPPHRPPGGDLSLRSRLLPATGRGRGVCRAPLPGDPASPAGPAPVPG